MQRSTQLEALSRTDRFDVLVIGGGATGLGVALDAAARGYRTALLEAHDFGKGTSSRSTKLVHGGVRYLAQGRIGLVREALHERATLLANAPHLASPLPFVMPTRRWVDKAFYGLGLKAYEALAGRRSLGPTEGLSAAEAATAIPGLNPAAHHGGVRYWDAQFDDARLAVALARTALAKGAVVLNHAPVVRLLRGSSDHNARVRGVEALDTESGRPLQVRASCVINATGVWVDAIRAMETGENGAAPAARRRLVTPSQGVHLVVAGSVLGGEHALLVPRTSDGRVVFAVPWLGHTVLGTTDTPREDLPLEPRPFEEEVDFILREVAPYLRQPPTREDVLSTWVGLRPLVNEAGGAAGSGAASATAPATGSISREHTVRVSPAGLVTVTGGKWTTYRAMAEDVLQQAADAGLLSARPAGATESLRLRGADPAGPRTPLSCAPGLHLYGKDADAVQALPGAKHWLWCHEASSAGGGAAEGAGLSEAMVRFAARHEMARTVEDVLARRSRLLFLDARRAEALAGAVGTILADELGCALASTGVEAFEALARQYAGRPEPG